MAIPDISEITNCINHDAYSYIILPDNSFYLFKTWILIIFFDNRPIQKSIDEKLEIFEKENENLILEVNYI